MNSSNEFPRGTSRGKRSGPKGPKKPPQRGLGVEKLERMRIQEQWEKLHESQASGAPMQLPNHDHHHCPHCPPAAAPLPNNHVRFGPHVHPLCPPLQPLYPPPPPPSPHGHGNTCPHFPGLTIPPPLPPAAAAVGGRGGFPGGANGGLFGSNQVHRPVAMRPMMGSYGSGAPVWVGGPLIGTPVVESSSYEFPSTPNRHSHPNTYFDASSVKKTRFNEEIRRDRQLEELRRNGQDFFGFNMPQSAPPTPNHFFGSSSTSFFSKQPRNDAASSSSSVFHNPTEVTAAHRRGNSVNGNNGKSIKEYEFFPAKDGSGTNRKELNFPPIAGSVAAAAPTPAVGTNEGSSSSSTITAARPRAYGGGGGGGDSASSSSVDLCLKLGHS